MSVEIIAAIITAVAVIIAATIPILIKFRQSQSDDIYQSQATQNSQTKIERELRNDRKVKRLLTNRNWNGAAEAAIAYFTKGTECHVKSWETSSSWEQVKEAYDRLKPYYEDSGTP